MNTVAYLNLSALAYVDFLDAHKNKSIESLISEYGIISKDELNKKPELFALQSPSSPLRSWILVNFQSNTPSGFAAVAFQNPETKEVVFAFRGTEPDKGIYTFLQDAITDAQIAVSGGALGKPNQFNDAFIFSIER